MSGYSAFAAYYDLLMQNADYKNRARIFRDLLDQYGVKDGILLDLACGTGTLSLEMDAYGYDVIGVDASEWMLSEAQRKAAQADRQILFLCQMMQQLDLYGTVRSTICALDSLNHLVHKADFEETIRRVSLFTEPDGVFLFDVNTPYKHRHVLADHTFILENDEVYCVWQNEYHASKETVRITLDFFEKDADAYYRSTEVFDERAYEIDYIRSVLMKNDFIVRGIFSEDGDKAVRPDAQRLIFAAQKKGNAQ